MLIVVDGISNRIEVAEIFLIYFNLLKYKEYFKFASIV